MNSPLRTTSRPPSSQVKCETWKPDSWLAVRARWRELEAKLSNVPTVCTTTWTDCWIRHFGDLIPHSFRLLRQADVVVGVALVTEGQDQFDGPFRVKTKHLGTSGEPPPESVYPEYNSLLCEPTLKADFTRRIISGLAEDSRWDEIRFDGFSATDPALQPVLASPLVSVRSRPSWYCDLKMVREGGGELIEHRGRSTRSRIRQNLKLYPEARVEWAESVDHACEIFENLICLHQSRWEAAGEPGCYASKRFRDFHLDLLPVFFEEGRVALTRTWSGGTVLACNQYWIADNHLESYQAGNISQTAQGSPGLVSEHLVQEEALRRGFDRYDFLAGDTLHKQRFSTDHEELVWVAIRRKRMKFVLVEQARRLRQYWRTVRQPAKGKS